MSPELWQRVKPLFDAASEMDPAERSPYLDRICAGDTELRREVDRLLDQHDAESAVLDKSPLSLNLFDISRQPVCALQAGDVLAGQFKIVRFVQRGGMGEVYEASDLEFGGSVALKTLRPALVHDGASLERFRREVQIAKRVTHRNLCRIFDGRWHRGEGKEIAFLTMEFLHGDTLSKYLATSGPVHPADALPLLRQIAEGLSALHEADIVHRDLKPGNVILVPAESCPARAVITDFGLARLVDVKNASDRVTQGTSSWVGTPEYMAPEQLAGEKDTDLGPYSDIYAFGTVAYEMLCGRLPFDGKGVGTLIVQKLTTAPPTPTEIIPEISTGWEKFILRCLEREPEERIQTAAELLQWLDELESEAEGAGPAVAGEGAPGGGRAAPGRSVDLTSRPTIPIEGLKHGIAPVPPTMPPLKRPRWRFGLAAAAALVMTAAALLQWPPVRTPLLRSLCVRFPGTAMFCELPADKDVALLPFKMTAPDQDSEMVAAGLGGFLRDSLYRLAPDKGSLCVHVRGGTRSLETYGAALALTGEISMAEDRVRLTARLEELPEEPQGERLLMRRFEVAAPAGDIQAAALRMVDSLAGMLEVEFPRDAMGAWKAELPREPEAFSSYLRGRAILEAGRAKVGPEGEPDFLAAAEQFNRAIDQHYTFALAHVGLGDAYRLMFERTADQKWPVRARNAYQEALGLHPELATAYRGLGELEMALGDNAAARKQYAEANRIDPYDHDVQIKYAAALEAAGLSDETQALWERSIELRPECWYGYNEIARFHLDHGRRDEALKAHQKIIQLAPTHAAAHHNLARAYIKIGRYEDAIVRAADSVRFGAEPLGYSTLGRAYLYWGCVSDALTNLQHAVTEAERIEIETGRAYARRFLLWKNLADGLLAAKRGTEAQQAHRKVVEYAREFLAVEPRYRIGRAYLALGLANLGDREAALRESATLLQSAPANEEALFEAAVIHETAGLRSRAIELLELALQQGLSVHEIRQDYRLAGLHDSPGWRDLLTRYARNPDEFAGSTTYIGDAPRCPDWSQPGKGLN